MSDLEPLFALAIDQRAYLVTGDQDLLVISNDFPILTLAHFTIKLREGS
jgi:predicted nucleic acid-binding protein